MSMLYYADIFTNPDLLMQSENIKKLPEGQHTFAMLAEAFNIDVYEARLRMFPNFMSRKRMGRTNFFSSTWPEETTIRGLFS